MPRNQGTSRKGKPKKEMRAAGFGKALQRSSKKRYVPKSNGASNHGQGMMATGAENIGTEEVNPESTKMRSVLEIDDLSDFLHQAQMANQEFKSEREQFLNLDSVGHEYRPDKRPMTDFGGGEASERAELEKFSFRELGVPRRPAWIPGVTTPEELDANEIASFLDWRRGVAGREEEIAAAAFEAGGAVGSAGASVTPYEKNIQVWRQLWRVLERSAVVIQIVDARNPLFYLSDDLRRYATDELGKPMLILVNKSDYLTQVQRKAWSEYFTESGVDHLFFSAVNEQEKIDKAAVAAMKGEIEDDGLGDSLSDSDDEEVDANEAQVSTPPVTDGVADDGAADFEDLTGVTNPLTREDLLVALEAFAESHGCKPDPKYDNRIQYGMVGFPNVGKSSVINVLVGSSKSLHGVARVAVASQPGKTKHFQTLLLPDKDDVMLCDCPGLVFPSFVSSSADMIAAGVYPIAQMRDHWPVVALICDRIPRQVLNAQYSIKLPEPTPQELKEKGLKVGAPLPPPTAEELLGTFCIARSILAPSSGVPDYQRASRVVIKDYAAGKLLFCHAPPTRKDENSINLLAYHRETLRTAIRNTKKLEQMQQMVQNEQRNKEGVGETGEDVDLDLDDFDSFLELEDQRDDGGNNGDKRGKSHQTIKKWGKKGRKLRNKDPYGCHTDPNDSALESTSKGSGVIVNAGKYSSSGYTRMNYAGSRGAVKVERTISKQSKPS